MLDLLFQFFFVNLLQLLDLSSPSSDKMTLSIPSSLSWYCAASHTAASNYTLPPQLVQQNDYSPPTKTAELIHLIHVQRHSKRTPVNLLPNEQFYNPPEGWNCNNIEYYNYAHGKDGSTNIQKQFQIPDWHPLKSRFWNGTCESGPLTVGGLHDAFQQGKDLWSVYGPKGKNPIHKFGTAWPKEQNTLLRNSPEERTFQVASGLLHGMGVPDHEKFKSSVLPSTLDNIVPSYSCSHANDLRNTINSEKEWTDHIASKADLFGTLNDVLGTTNLSGWNSWIDHAFDALSSRQCNGHPLPTNPQTGKSITQEIANQVYEEGNWEYNYIWNASPNADEYTKYSIGLLVKEIALLLQSIQDGKNDKKFSLFVDHDGTMVRLFKTVGMAYIMWPGMGSELNFEIYKTKEKTPKHYVRILSYGKTLNSTVKALTGSDKAAEASWAPLENVIAYLNDRVPADLATKCA